MALKIRIVFGFLVLQLFINLIYPVHAAPLNEQQNRKSIREYDNNHHIRKRSVTIRIIAAAFTLRAYSIFERIYNSWRDHIKSKVIEINNNNNKRNMKINLKRMKPSIAKRD